MLSEKWFKNKSKLSEKETFVGWAERNLRGGFDFKLIAIQVYICGQEQYTLPRLHKRVIQQGDQEQGQKR